MEAEVTQDRDRALVGSKDGEPCAEVSSDYKGAANLKEADNLKAFARGWKSVLQEEHGDAVVTCVDGVPRPGRPGEGRGGVQHGT